MVRGSSPIEETADARHRIVPRPPDEDVMQVTQSINMISLTLIEDYQKMFQVLPPAHTVNSPLTMHDRSKNVDYQPYYLRIVKTVTPYEPTEPDEVCNIRLSPECHNIRIQLTF